MMKIRILLLLLVSLLLMSCNTIWDETYVTPDPDTDAEGYYQTLYGSFTLKYKVESGTHLRCKLSANGSGWIAVGFAPAAMMKDANVIIGYVHADQGFIRDDFGTSHTEHESDLSLGGSSDVELLTAYEANGKTHLEFRIPLDSGDSKDRPLVIGSEYPIIFASGNEDDFDSYHSAIGTGVIQIR